MLALELADEVEAVEVFGAVVGAGAASVGGGKETLLDVIPDGADADVRLSAEFGEVEGSVRRHTREYTV
jgi:hypothetical protein